MRTAFTALLAFAAGVLLMLLLAHAPTPGGAATTGPAAAGSSVATASSSEDNPAEADSSSEADSDNWPNDAPTPEQVLYSQPKLLREALARLHPRTPGKPNLYLLAFAGDGSEDVFRNEAEYASQLFAERFGASGHTLVLENNPATLSTRPLASWSNLESALDSLADVMKPDQDILVLYLTSHGSEDHSLLVDMDPLPLDQLGAKDLGDILNKRPFKWKVVVVNACYSGGFVPELRGPGTLVLTAARSDRSSFGCGNDADATYFGRAWLIDALNHTADFADAFKQASGEISDWEKRDKLVPSEPQIDIGNGIDAQLAAWRKTIVAGPAVAFKPAVPASAGTAAVTK